MLYLFSDNNQVKLLFQKKTMLGQYESAFYEKTHQLNLTENGQIVNMDFYASAIREALTIISPAAIKEKELNLILPQEAFFYMRAEVPMDIANSAITGFIRDKARTQITGDIENYLTDYVVQENEKGKQILFYAISNEVLSKYQQALQLLNLQITNVIPEPLTYFKLFEKTLRKDKKEYILYACHEKSEIKCYAYDTYGPLEDKKIVHKITATHTPEHILKKIADEYEAKGQKLNRLILSGQDSENIRQDTFTKDVGVWTNPLKRIIPQFYEDYLKILVASPNSKSPNNGNSLPFLLYDVCIGAFIFALENKQFSFFKKGGMKINKSGSSSSAPKQPRNIRLPLKEILLFIASFGLSFLLISLYMKFDANKVNTNKTVATADTKVSTTPSPTKAEVSPTPAIDREEIRVKVLNGSGTKGKAAEVKALLQEKGYGEILTGNADNFDYTNSEIQVSSEIKGLKELVVSDLKDNTAKPKVTTLDKSETAADVVVIFGTDFK